MMRKFNLIGPIDLIDEPVQSYTNVHNTLTATAAVKRQSNELSARQIWVCNCCREVKRSIGSTHLAGL